MTAVGFGGAGGSAFTAFFPIQSGPIGLPSGRAMANGSTACLLALTSILVGGNGAARSGSASLAGSGGGFSVGNTTPVSVGVGSGYVLVNGGSAYLSISASGSLRYGRAGGGTTNDLAGGGSSNFAGTIGGSYDWVQAPSEPTLNAVTSSATRQIEYNFSGSADNGGSAISTYRVEYATNAGFSGSSYIETGTGVGAITGLTPGLTYYVRVSARNAVTDAAGTLGAYSAVLSVQALGGTKVGVAGVWKDATVYAGINGVWIPVQVFAGRAGAWVGLTS